MKQSSIPGLAGIAAGFFLLVSCSSLPLPGFPRSGGGGRPGPGGPPAVRLQSVPPLRNNSTINLPPGRYEGVIIQANRVTLVGSGNTVIQGNVVITGNTCVIRNLTIEGNVTINANNADLTGARVTGRVTSNGNNNRY